MRTHFIFYANVFVHNTLCFRHIMKQLLHTNSSYSPFSSIKYYLPMGSVHYSTIYAQGYRQKAHNGNDTKIIWFISNYFQFLIMKMYC